MGPILILDKSTFQSLNHQEIALLTRYFTINITQVLIIEIIADLKKGTESNLNEDEVVKIAKKAHPKDTAFNHYFREILVQDLLFGNVDLKWAKVFVDAIPVKDNDGKIGYQVRTSAEDKAFNKWKKGEFDFSDEFLAKRWRELTGEIDLNELISNLKTNKFFEKKLRSLDEASEYLNSFLSDTDTDGDELLKILINDFSIEPEYATQIFYRWESNNFKRLKDFSRFGIFCLKTVTLFYLALVNELITKRPTNRVDLEYIFYLPFCNVFVSDDRFHRRIVPKVLLGYNDFIRGQELKEDLNRIADYIQQNKDQDYLRKPPKFSNSIVYNLWEKYTSKSANHDDLLSKMSDAEKEELLKKINKQWDSVKKRTEPLSSNFEDHDFFIREREVLLTDPCICGSGVEFRNCCYKKVKK